MATYDPQKGHARPKPAEDAPVPVDDLLDAAGDPGGAPAPTEVPVPVTRTAPVAPVAPEAAATAPPGPRGGPAKKVGIGVAVTAVLFALRWALKRKKRDRSERA